MMLESLVSSRIRRTLLEYILLHPTARFYLRGLAKELNLSITPLRRELKRLTVSGVLQACQEGNVLFYTVNTHAAAYLQLQQAGFGMTGLVPQQQASTMTAGSMYSEAPASTVAVQAIPVGIVSATAPVPEAHRPLHGALFLAIVGAGLVLMVIAVAIGYLTMTNERLMKQASHVLTTRNSHVTVVVPPASASGTMRGSRWQVVPGGFGSFSSGADTSSY